MVKNFLTNAWAGESSGDLKGLAGIRESVNEGGTEFYNSDDDEEEYGDAGVSSNGAMIRSSQRSGGMAAAAAAAARSVGASGGDDDDDDVGESLDRLSSDSELNDDDLVETLDDAIENAMEKIIRESVAHGPPTPADLYNSDDDDGDDGTDDDRVTEGRVTVSGGARPGDLDDSDEDDEAADRFEVSAAAAQATLRRSSAMTTGGGTALLLPAAPAPTAPSSSVASTARAANRIRTTSADTGAAAVAAPAASSRNRAASEDTGAAVVADKTKRRSSLSSLGSSVAATFGWGGVSVPVTRASVDAAKEAEVRGAASRNRRRSEGAATLAADAAVVAAADAAEVAAAVAAQEVAKAKLKAGTITVAEYNEVVRKSQLLIDADSGVGGGGGGGTGHFACPECGTLCKDASRLSAHFDAAHSEVHANVFACPECYGNFSDAAALTAHFQDKEPDGRCKAPAEDLDAGEEDLGARRSASGTAPAAAPAAAPSAAPAAAPSAARRRLRGGVLGVMAQSRSAKAEETIFSAVSRRVSQKSSALAEKAAAAMGGDGDVGDGSVGAGQAAVADPEVSDTALVQSFASLLISLKNPEYLRAFVLERGGIETLATMSAHIVSDARARAKADAKQAKKSARANARAAAKAAKRAAARAERKRARQAAKFLDGEDDDDQAVRTYHLDDEDKDDEEEDEDEDDDAAGVYDSDDFDDSDDDSDSDDEFSGNFEFQPEAVLTVNEVTLQHCVLKAVLTVLDSGPGLQWVLGAGGSGGGERDGEEGEDTANEDAFASIFENIQASGQRQHMGKLYAIATSLCYHPEHGAKGQRLFMRCLDAADASRPDRPRFDAVRSPLPPPNL